MLHKNSLDTLILFSFHSASFTLTTEMDFIGAPNPDHPLLAQCSHPPDAVSTGY